MSLDKPSTVFELVEELKKLPSNAVVKLGEYNIDGPIDIDYDAEDHDDGNGVVWLA